MINKKNVSITFTYIILCAVVIFALVSQLKLRTTNLSVPYNYWGDTVWFSVPIKGMIDNGWVYEIPQLSAPFSLSAAAFPSMTHVDWVMMKIISQFYPNYGMVLNLFWLLSIILSALTSTIAMSMLGVRVKLAAVFGLIYAFLPYAILRNVAHISLVYYFVPLLCLSIIWIAEGCAHPNSKSIRLLGYFAALLQGFNYIYFSFFSLILLVFSAAHGYIRLREFKPIKESIVLAVILLSAATLNLAPSFSSWEANGRPPDIAYKYAAEAEIYALKIRKMLVPHEDNNVPIFNSWSQLDKNAHFPNENENAMARLGPMASIGLIFIFSISLGLINFNNKKDMRKVMTLANITIFVVLFATVGGFGSILNLAIPDFRTYNRFSVFIAFFSLSAVAFLWQSMYQNAVKTSIKVTLVVILFAMSIFSLYDQFLDFSYLRSTRKNEEREASQLREIIQKVEALVPSGSMVFQLPISGFPADGGNVNMLPYDHGKAYLASTNLKWSWPSFSVQHRNWLYKTQSLSSHEMLEVLAIAKFRLIWIDRFGYSDHGDEIYSNLVRAGAKEVLSHVSNRYVILDLSDYSNALRDKIGVQEIERLSVNMLYKPNVVFSKGFYNKEFTPEGNEIFWSQKVGVIEIYNYLQSDQEFKFTFLAAGKQGPLTVAVENEKYTEIIDSTPVAFSIPVRINAASKIRIVLYSEAGKINVAPDEKRDLHFIVMDPKLESNNRSNF